MAADGELLLLLAVLPLMPALPSAFSSMCITSISLLDAELALIASSSSSGTSSVSPVAADQYHRERHETSSWNRAGAREEHTNESMCWVASAGSSGLGVNFPRDERSKAALGTTLVAGQGRIERRAGADRSGDRERHPSARPGPPSKARGVRRPRPPHETSIQQAPQLGGHLVPSSVAACGSTAPPALGACPTTR